MTHVLGWAGIIFAAEIYAIQLYRGWRSTREES